MARLEAGVHLLYPLLIWLKALLDIGFGFMPQTLLNGEFLSLELDKYHEIG
jgi:hypothetical protein